MLITKEKVSPSETTQLKTETESENEAIEDKTVVNDWMVLIEEGNTYLSSQYHRFAARMGKKRVAVAVGHTILTIFYYLLNRRQQYN